MVFLRSYQMFRVLFVMKQTLKPFCFLFLISIYVDQSKSKGVQQPSSKRCVVVFNVEDTLCKPCVVPEEAVFAGKKHPECPIIHWTHDGLDHPFIFLPYLQILFNYLLEKGARIAFFPTVNKEGNTVVVSELLTSFWGSKRYEELKSKGQFSIFSKGDMRKGNGSGEGNFVKDLKVVVQDGESLSDCILVEDDRRYSARDQQPCMDVLSLGFWELYGDHDPYEFPKNTIYYMLGLFKTYFEHDKYKKLPLREGLAHIIPAEKEKEGYYSFFEANPFARKMMEMGLSEVQKEAPSAKLYGSSGGKKFI